MRLWLALPFTQSLESPPAVIGAGVFPGEVPGGFFYFAGGIADGCPAPPNGRRCRQICEAGAPGFGPGFGSGRKKNRRQGCISQEMPDLVDVGDDDDDDDDDDDNDDDDANTAPSRMPLVALLALPVAAV